MSDLASGEKVAQDEAERFRMFDPWLVTTHPLSKHIAANVTSYLELHEDPRRKRRIKKQDQENRAAVIHALFANIAYARALNEAHGRTGLPKIGVSLRAAKRTLTRYDRKGFASLPKILEVLSAHQQGGYPLFSLEKSHQRGSASTVTAAPHFAANFDGFKLTAQHFHRQPGGELIWLTQTTRNYVEDTRQVEPINYDDTPETLSYREEMERINAHLRDANMEFLPDGGPLVIVTDRELTRQFKQPLGEEPHRFDLCGRLFPGWWQTLESERRAAIRIDGEQIADLDFSNMFLRLAYLSLGREPPPGDLYSMVPGLSEVRWRAGVKAAVSAMLCRKGVMQRLPGEIKAELPPRASASQIREAIIAGHPTLEGVFETGLGLHLMFTESQILVSALLRLIQAGITALPMHDGLMVARSKAEPAAAAMGDAAEAVTGYRLPISLKTQY